jgi:hypothetical protein
MFARMPFASLSSWGRTSLVLALTGLPLYASCTKSEDTEPNVPATEGAKQPAGSGALVSETDACTQLLDAANAAYKRLHCEAAPKFPKCPDFLRPGGGSGCYEYYENSVTACVKAYSSAGSCGSLAPCFAAAERNDGLSTCEALGEAGAGAGGSPSTAGAPGSGGMTDVGGNPALPEGGMPAAGGADTAGAGGAT